MADRVAYEQKVKQFEQQKSTWDSQIAQQATQTAERINNFLQFPECIWVDSEPSIGSAESDGASIANSVPVELLPPRRSVFDDEQELDDTVAATVATDTVMDADDVDDDVNSAYPPFRTTTITPSYDDNEFGHSLVVKMLLERKQEEWNQRKHQLDALRRIYIPQFILLLHSVYFESGNYKECMNIANIVADEHKKLYSTFTTEQLQSLLHKLRETSILILDTCSDPLGYVKRSL